MDKKMLGSLVKNARGRKTQKDLAALVGISRTYLGDIETGRIEPSFTILCRIANHCGVDLNYFGEQIAVKEPTKIALYDVQGGTLMPIGTHMDPYADADLIAITVPDDSMSEAKLNKGDVVIVKKGEEGSVVVVEVSGEIMIRRMHRDGKRIILTPANAAYSPSSFLEKQVKIIGAVVRAQIKDVQAKVSRLLDAIEDGTAPEDVKERLGKRRQELDALRERETFLNDQACAQADHSTIRSFLEEHRDNLYSADPVKQRKTIETFVEKVVVFPDRFECVFRIESVRGKGGGGEPLWTVPLTFPRGTKNDRRFSKAPAQSVVLE